MLHVSSLVLDAINALRVKLENLWKQKGQKGQKRQKLFVFFALFAFFVSSNFTSINPQHFSGSE
jgi:hypothetical protein